MTPVFQVEVGSLGWAPSLPALLALLVLVAVVSLSVHRARARLADAGALRRGAVTGLNALALLAMAALLAPPTLERTASGEVVLLTPGVREPVPAIGPVFSLAGPGADDEPEIQRLRTAGQLALRRPDLESLHVLGHGLTEAEWRTLPSRVNVRFDPPPLEGPVRPAWPRALEFGETLRVTGELRLAVPDQVAELRLVDPADRVVDVASVRSGQSFALEAVPRAPGAVTYRLLALRGGEPFAEEAVTTHVHSGRGGRLLVLQSAPSFDTRQLANWSSDRGNPLVIRTRVSRDRDLVQGINLPADAPLDLTPDLLAETDLAVLDGRRWVSLAPGERTLLLDAVRDGLGLLLLADAELAEWMGSGDGPALAGATLQATSETDPLWPAWDGTVPERPLPVAPFRLVPDTARRLTTSETGELLETWAPLGRGRVAVSLLRERHRWATSDENTAFTRYWSRLLRLVGREDPEPRWLAPDARELPGPGERRILCAATDRALRFRVSPLGAPEIARESALVPHGLGAPLSCGYDWPAEPGWRRLDLLENDGSILDTLLVHVSGNEAWRAAAAERRQVASLRRAAETVRDAPPRQVTVPLDPSWAWALLLISGGLLWAERRLAELD